MNRPKSVQWNPDYETFETVHSDGYIEPLRDSVEAGMTTQIELADEQIPELTDEQGRAMLAALQYHKTEDFPDSDFRTADMFRYVRLLRLNGYQEYIHCVAFAFRQANTDLQAKLNSVTEISFDYQRVISLVAGSISYCKGGRPLVPGLICPHCDLDTSNDYECPKPRMFGACREN